MTRQEQLIGQAQNGDKNARNQVVSENLGLVHAVVRRFERRGHDREELFQIGCIGLIKAIDHFNLSFHLAFSTYAVPMITGEIRRFLRDDGMVKVSRSLKENGYKISQAKEVLTRELGREPGILEIAALTQLSQEEIVMALEANRDVESIYQPVCGTEGDELLLIDQIGAQKANEEEPEKEEVLNKMLVRQLMEQLNKKEQKMITLRYFEGKTQCETAKELSMSQVQVSRLERKILNKMRQQLL